MVKGENLAAEAVLAALYLRGAPHGQPLSRRRWGLVRDALLSETPPLGSVSKTLKEQGLWDESLAVEAPAALDWGLQQVESGRALTVANSSYPERWTAVLGAWAPPAVWMVGRPSSAPPVSVVGSRELSAPERAFARKLGRRLMAAGRCLVSGGAIGADTETARGALLSGAEGRMTLILPYGTNLVRSENDVCLLSVCEPDAPFSTGQAMERNALIYAFSPLTVVVKARYRTGGTWFGASDALRRRLTRLAVRAADSDKAVDALCRLGGIAFRSVDDVFRILDETDDLYGMGRLTLTQDD